MPASSPEIPDDADGTPPSVSFTVLAGSLLLGVVSAAGWFVLGDELQRRLIFAVLIVIAVVGVISQITPLSRTLSHGTPPRKPPPRVVPPRPAPPATGAEPLTVRWQAALGRHDSVLRSYLPYETDPIVVLSYPALTDVSEPASAAFFDAMHDADVLRSDDRPGDETAEAYVAAVSTLVRAWSAAERNARRIGNQHLAENDRRTAEQAIKLLRHAEGAPSDVERRSYAERAYTLLKQLTDRAVIVMPPRAMRAIEAQRRREITG